jgi:hypothetical protein
MNIRQHLTAKLKQDISEFREVVGAADLPAKLLKRGVVLSPSLFVVQVRTDATENDTMNGVSQRLTHFFDVAILVENKRDTYGTDSSDVLNELRKKVEEALLGWIVPLPATPQHIEYAGGELYSLEDTLIIWRDTYLVYEYIDHIGA